MNKKNYHSLVGIFLFVCFLVPNLIGQKKTLSKEQCIEDLEYLRTALEEIHPSVPRYTSEEALNERIDSLIQTTTDSFSSWTFQMKVRSALTMVGCIHTNAYSPKIKKKNRPAKPLDQFPFSFYTDGKDIFIDELRLDSLDRFLGTQVLRIDGKKPKEILQSLYQYRSGDGQINPFMNGILNNGDNFRILLEAYFKFDSIVHMKILSKDLGVKDITIRRGVVKTEAAVKKKPEKWDLHIKNHYYRTDSTNTYGYLKIPSFSAKRWRSFYKKVITDLNEKNIENFVVDLRSCPGGNILETHKLLSMVMDTTIFYTMEQQRKPIWKYVNGQSKMFILADWMKWRFLNFAKKSKTEDWKIIEQTKKPNAKINYDGQVYVFVDEISSSSATVVASYLKEKANAIVIGRETGGGAAGNSGLYYPKSKLPNSKILIRMPQYWINYHLLNDEGRGVIPDFPVEYTIDDILAKKDKEMDVFLELIKQKRKA